MPWKRRRVLVIDSLYALCFPCTFSGTCEARHGINTSDDDQIDTNCSSTSSSNKIDKKKRPRTTT